MRDRRQFPTSVYDSDTYVKGYHSNHLLVVLFSIQPQSVNATFTQTSKFRAPSLSAEQRIWQFSFQFWLPDIQRMSPKLPLMIWRRHTSRHCIRHMETTRPPGARFPPALCAVIVIDVVQNDTKGILAGQIARSPIRWGVLRCQFHTFWRPPPGDNGGPVAGGGWPGTMGGRVEFPVTAVSDCSPVASVELNVTDGGSARGALTCRRQRTQGPCNARTCTCTRGVIRRGRD